MNDTMVTLQGWVGGDVTGRDAAGARVATFRIATAPRHWSRRSEEWVEGPTQWFTVCAWRGLATNVEASVRRGDPVVVHGRLHLQTWTDRSGAEVSGWEIEAVWLGHDLSRGRSSFTRTPRPAPAADPVAAPTATPESDAA